MCMKNCGILSYCVKQVGKKSTILFSETDSILLFFLLFLYFSSFIPNSVLTDSFLFGVSRKCLAAQRSKILMPAEYTQLFQLFPSQISSV